MRNRYFKITCICIMVFIVAASGYIIIKERSQQSEKAEFVKKNNDLFIEIYPFYLEKTAWIEDAEYEEILEYAKSDGLIEDILELLEKQKSFDLLDEEYLKDKKVGPSYNYSKGINLHISSLRVMLLYTSYENGTLEDGYFVKSDGSKVSFEEVGIKPNGKEAVEEEFSKMESKLWIERRKDALIEDRKDAVKDLQASIEFRDMPNPPYEKFIMPGLEEAFE